MNGKVWVLHRDDAMPNEPTYGDAVVDVYSSKEKAEAAMQILLHKRQFDDWPRYEIVEYEVL